MTAFLTDIIWHTLSGPHAVHSTGTATARRYASGFSPIIAFAAREQPDFAALAPFCAPGEHFYCDGWSGPAPAGWQVEAESTMFKMVWQGGLPGEDSAPDAVPLTAAHAPQALALATLTRPGPFGLRTIELGDYFGFVEDGELIAMAGERMDAGALREISGVCTDPRHQGRGLARRLMLKLIRRQMLRQQTPFLHVMSENTAAHSLYQRMGFVDQHESVVRVVAYTG